jgi:hypothetical protein
VRLPEVPLRTFRCKFEALWAKRLRLTKPALNLVRLWLFRFVHRFFQRS